jgi:phosphopantetheinyl transferase
VVGTQECGIDIEQKFPYRASLARRICHPREWKIFQEILSQEQQVQLQILWSLKESFVKRDGRGLGYGMETIDLSDLMPFPQQGQSEEQGLWWNAADNYTIAVCTPQKIETVICMGEQQLMDHR